MIGSVFMLSATLSAGNAEFDRTAAEGAAQIAAARFAEELSVTGPGAGLLRDAMLADPGAYSGYDTASNSCHVVFVEKSKAAFEAECREIRKRLELPEDYPLVFAEDFYSKLDMIYPTLFDSERKEAVSKQAERIVSDIRPGEADFESQQESELKQVITELVVEGQEVPVFEENRLYISEKIVDPMIAGAYAERRRQREYLMRARCDAAAPSLLAAELTDKLIENVDERRAKEQDAVRWWGSFASVTNVAMSAAVEKRTVDRLISKTDELKFPIDAASVEAVIEKNPEAHIKARASESVFVDIYTEEVMALALSSVLGDVPDSEREELEAYLKERLDSEDVGKATQRVIRREVMPKWKAARDAVAKRQAEAIWPELVKGEWFPAAAIADEMVARSDYANALRDWRSLDELKVLADADNGRAVLEETTGRIDKEIAKAFDVARSAIAAQNAIAESEHIALLEELRSSGVKPKVDAIAEKLTDKSIEKWNASRLSTLWPDGNVPENGDEQHRELFPSVQRKIELLAKSILEELNEPLPEEPTPEEPKPEEDPVENPEEMPEEFEFTISVSRSGDKVEVKLLKGKEAVVERLLDAKMAPFDSAMEEVSDHLGRKLLKLK